MRYWNKALSLVKGCTRVSSGCDNCWYHAMQARFPATLGSGGDVSFNGAPLCKLERSRKPYVWAVWSDLFHEAIDEDTILRCLGYFERAAKTGQIVLVLTKRPSRAAKLWPRAISNVWLGTSAENQATFDQRWIHMRAVQERTNQRVFLSAEPVLESFTILQYKPDVVIAGPETGPRKRPCESNWLHILEHNSASQGARFLRKDKPAVTFDALEFWK